MSETKIFDAKEATKLGQILFIDGKGDETRRLTLPITGLRQTAKRAVAIPADWRVRPHFVLRQAPCPATSMPFL